MAKRSLKIPDLTDKTCRLAKIGNNLEHHGKEWVTAFTLPISGMMLTAAELNAFMRDKHCHRSWFDTSKPGAAEPMPWWNGEPFTLSREYEADRLTIVVSGDQALDFQSVGDPKDDNYRAACRISDIKLVPQVGGMTEITFKLYVLPDIGRTNLLLQEHQHREIRISWADGRELEKRTRQPELPMGQGEDGGAAPAGEGGAAAGSAEEVSSAAGELGVTH